MDSNVWQQEKLTRMEAQQSFKSLGGARNREGRRLVHNCLSFFLFFSKILAYGMMPPLPGWVVPTQ